VSAFDVEAPQWGRISPLRVVSTPRLMAGAVEFETTAGTLQVELHEFGVRVRVGTPTREWGILVAKPARLAASLDASAGRAFIRARTADGRALELEVEFEPLAFTLRCDARLVQRSPTDGHFVRRFRVPPLARLEDAWLLALELGAATPVYGLGEKSGRLDKRGQLVRSFNHDALGVNAEASYKNTPFAWSPEGWGVFVHTAHPVTHAVGFGPWSQRAYVLKVDGPGLDVFMFTAPHPAGQIAAYTELTGRAPVPPAWSFGVILSRAYYRTADDILDVAREVRARGMPCDVITFDGRAWQDTDTRFAFEWDPKRYPDPRPVIESLKALGFRICVWEYPLISVRSPLFAAAADRGWLLRDRRTGEPYRFQWDLEPFGAVLTPLPESGLLDFTHPEAYAWWRDQHRALFELGVDMIKADFGEQIEPEMLASNGASGDELHNVYALLYNRCVYEAAARYAEEGPFLFSRAAWSGSQRYPAQWGGDPQADFGGLAGNLRSGLSWGLSGAPYYATDVGGFYADTRDPVLYVRWIQAAVYSAHMRLHGIGAREPWSYGPEAARAATAALELRYRLIPYLHRAARQAADSGLPVQRPMVLACPDDPAAWAFEDQFFCGDDLLVVPCLSATGCVRFYLPAGEWCSFPGSGPRRWLGGRVHECELSLQQTAVFARVGTRIPLGAALQRWERGRDPAAFESEWIAH
jgi:alpha-D-xyloside xylohydrolase